MVPLDRLAQITERFEYIEAALNQGTGDIAALGREYAELRPVVERIAEYRALLSQMTEAEAMLSDPEMRELAEDELPALRARQPALEEALRLGDRIAVMRQGSILQSGTADELRRAGDDELDHLVGGAERAVVAEGIVVAVPRRRRSLRLLAGRAGHLGGHRPGAAGGVVVARVVFARVAPGAGVTLGRVHRRLVGADAAGRRDRHRGEERRLEEERA